MNNLSTGPMLVYSRLHPIWSSDAQDALSPAATTPTNGEPQMQCEVDLGMEWGTFATPSATVLPKVTDKVLSAHVDGFNAAFCDGHATFMRNSMDVSTFIHLMTLYDKGCAKNNTSGTYGKYCNVPDSMTPNEAGIPLYDVLDEGKLE